MPRGRAGRPARTADIVAPQQCFGFYIGLARYLVGRKTGGSTLQGVCVHQYGIVFCRQFFQQGRIQSGLFKTNFLANEVFKIFCRKILGNTCGFGLGSQRRITAQQKF